MDTILKYDKYSDYVLYLRNYLKAQKQRGIISRLAKRCNFSLSLLTQFLTLRKIPNQEQAYVLAKALDLKKNQIEYFITLRELHLTNLSDYAFHLREKLKMLSGGNEQKGLEVLNEFQLSKFYSSWIYSAVRLLTSIESLQTPNEISKKLDIDIKTTREILLFLAETGLIEQVNKDQFKLKVLQTAIDRDSLYSLRHHLNWRYKGIEYLQNRKKSDFVLTLPMTINAELFQRFVEILKEASLSIEHEIEKCEATDLYCLNVDLFKVL